MLNRPLWNSYNLSPQSSRSRRIRSTSAACRCWCIQPWLSAQVDSPATRWAHKLTWWLEYQKFDRILRRSAKESGQHQKLEIEQRHSCIELGWFTSDDCMLGSSWSCKRGRCMFEFYQIWFVWFVEWENRRAQRVSLRQTALTPWLWVCMYIMSSKGWMNTH